MASSKHYLAILAGVLLGPLGFSTAIAAPEIRLVLQITVDQLRGDLPLRHMEQFGKGGAPRSIYICDRPDSESLLQKPLAKLAEHYGGPVRFVSAKNGLPDAVYQCDIIVGASSNGGLLDPYRLKAGAVVVDDSFPPLCNLQTATKRMQQNMDVLIVGGGMVQMEAEQVDILIPMLNTPLRQAVLNLLTRGMPGCRLESLLLARKPDLGQILGLVQPEHALRYFQALAQAKVKAPDFHLGEYLIEPQLWAKLRELKKMRG